MRRPSQITAFALAAVLAAFSAAAPIAAYAAGEGLTVTLHESRLVAFHGVAATIVVGNPAVADVSVSNAHSLVLIGKGYGETQIIVADHDGHVLMQRDVSVVSADDDRVNVVRGQITSESACEGGRCHPIEAPHSVYSPPL